MVQRQPHRVCYFLDCPQKFRLRPLWWLQKISGFYSCRPPHFTRAGHRIVQSSGVSRVGLRGGVPKSRKCKWLVKVGAGKGDLKKSWPGGFSGNQKTPLDTPLQSTLLLSFFAAPVYKRECLSINTVYGISSLFTTEYFKNQNKNAHSPADWSLCAFSPLVSIQLRERASWV